jgi:hypothetical protein
MVNRTPHWLDLELASVVFDSAADCPVALVFTGDGATGPRLVFCSRPDQPEILLRGSSRPGPAQHQRTPLVKQ